MGKRTGKRIDVQKNAYTVINCTQKAVGMLKILKWERII